MDTKKCSKCQTAKPIDEFSKNRSKSDGLQSYCKPCKRSADKKYRTDNPERYREYDRKWKKANPEKHREWWEANPEKYREYKRKYREANPEKQREYMRKWQAEIRAADPLYVRLRNGFQRARRFDLEAVLFTGTELKEHWQSVGVDANACIYCNVQLDDTWHIDHAVPLSRGGGHTLTNVVPSCPGCNRAKGEMAADEFISAAPATHLGEGGS